MTANVYDNLNKAKKVKKSFFNSVGSEKSNMKKKEPNNVEGSLIVFLY